MKRHTISTIALSNEDFPSLEHKLEEAVKWIEIAAKQGAELAVLPEALGIYRGDGPYNPNAMPFEQQVLRNWRKETEILFDCAKRCGIAVTIPIYVEEDGEIANVFYLISRTGEIIGRYSKNYPTDGELDENVAVGNVELLEWEGLKIGGGICFDLNFRELFVRQKEAGAQLILCPSYTPGGRFLETYAWQLQMPFVLAYPAWSRIIDTNGRDLVAGGYRSETLRFGFGAPVYTATINFDKATFHCGSDQQKIQQILSERGDQIQIEMMQDEALFIAESIAEDYTIEDLIRDYEMTRLDDYMSKYNKQREQHLVGK